MEDKEKCKNCGGELVKRATRRNPAQFKKPYYFTAYYYCNHCRKLFHSEKFKVVNNPTSLFEDEKNDSQEFDAKIWTDGACVFNGHVNARAAWAFVSDGSGKSDEHEKAGLVEGKQTNNVAEALAIYHALLWAKEKGYKKILIHTDSQISINNMNKRTEDINQNVEIFRNIDRVIREGGLKVRFKKVLGHSGDINNEKADKLANQLATRG